MGADGKDRALHDQPGVPDGHIISCPSNTWKVGSATSGPTLGADPLACPQLHRPLQHRGFLPDQGGSLPTETQILISNGFMLKKFVLWKMQTLF